MTVFFLIVYTLMTVVLAANLLHLAWRGRIRARFAGRVSVLIPARNEEANLARLLPSLLGQQGIDFEVIVYDDASEDGTAAVVRANADERLRLLTGDGPPTGWVGKVHALYQASRDASGGVLLFLDADTAFKDPHALRRVACRYAALPHHSVLTALPHFRGAAPLLVSFVPYGLLTNLPMVVAERWGGKHVAALNGQCWMISRDDYLAEEPHLRHRNEVLEDVRIGRYLAGRGIRPMFADLQNELEVWMYSGMGEAWRGFRKNAYLLLGGRPVPFVLLFGLFTLTFVAAPFWSVGWLAWAVATKLVSDRFCRFPVWLSLAAPLTFVLWTALLLDSAWSHVRGQVMWKGRRVARTERPDRQE